MTGSLIYADAGGGGTFTIQLAKHAGAYVATTTAGTHNVEFLKSIGADEGINYKKYDFETILKDFDFVLDSLRGEKQEKIFTTLRQEGD